MNFNEFNFDPRVFAGVEAAGYQTPTPIQQQAMPAVLGGRDVMGLAQTGTGKTAAFALPILQRLLAGPRGRVRALVVAPTRELAEQIHQAVTDLGRKTDVRSLTLYGGVNINPQTQKLQAGVEIVVACPGRLLDHLNQGNIKLDHLEVLVLDEADQMFDMGFFPDIRRILKFVPSRRQTLLFSATMPPDIRTLAHEVLHDPVTVQVGNTAPPVTVTHAVYPVAQHLKTPLLLNLLQHTDTESVLIFTRTKHRARRLGEQLVKAGYHAASLQGNLSQNRRQAALNGFRQGDYQILVATDIAARGIDVSQISHVINYDIPDTPEAYVHRIGRTGRAARSGDAFTLVTSEDGPMVGTIERVLGSPLERRTVEGFDYSVPAPKKDQEFVRPPRESSQARKSNKAKQEKTPATQHHPDQGFGRPASSRPGPPVQRGGKGGSGRSWNNRSQRGR